MIMAIMVMAIMVVISEVGDTQSHMKKIIAMRAGENHIERGGGSRATTTDATDKRPTEKAQLKGEWGYTRGVTVKGERGKGEGGKRKKRRTKRASSKHVLNEKTTRKQSQSS